MGAVKTDVHAKAAEIGDGSPRTLAVTQEAELVEHVLRHEQIRETGETI
jgi:hypothetical protein